MTKIATGIEIFRNIRYARARRFEQPEVLPWDGVRNTERGPLCPQAPSRLALVQGPLAPLAMDEHCQVLSVFTPATQGKRPVMPGAWPYAEIGRLDPEGRGHVSTDLAPFGMIVPCGIRGRGVTSMQRLLGAAPSLSEVAAALVPHFEAVFGRAAAPPGVDAAGEARAAGSGAFVPGPTGAA